MLVVFGTFIAVGVYALMDLWSHWGGIILSWLQSFGLPQWLTTNMLGIGIVVGGLLVFSLLMAIGAAYVAKRMGGTLIYLGAAFMNVMTWLVVLLFLFLNGWNLSLLMASWGMMIPGLFTLFMTLLLFTVFRDRVRRAGEIIKLTGQVCLDEKGVFVPPLFTMVFTLISAVLFGGIILWIVPWDVIVGTDPWTLNTAVPFGLGLLLYLFTTIFLYNAAYATSSSMVYIYMRGRDPSLRDGIRGAMGVVGGLAALAMMSVVVVIVRMVLERLGRQAGGATGAAVGRVAGGIVAWVWMLINYFTIPAMVAEQTGARASIKRSAGLVRKNFVDVMIKETAVRWAFGVLAGIFLIAFAVGGAAIGWFLTGDIFVTVVVAIVFTIFAGIPSSLVLRTFDIVYVTLLYVFIRKQEGEISGKTAISGPMEDELQSAYRAAKKSQ
ncbi:MAG: hypothetical protein HXY34_07325 [Candidatus Thorarchaeota archaeon]|nr:hypothetical protein [Candidatus Thorarchaeota archaeon]